LLKKDVVSSRGRNRKGPAITGYGGTEARTRFAGNGFFNITAHTASGMEEVLSWPQYRSFFG